MPTPAVMLSARDAGTDRPAVLALEQVTRQYGGRVVWAPLDLRVEPGTLTLLTGDNGSGKTTLLRLAAGLLRPSTGQRSCTDPALYLRAGSGLRSAPAVGDAVAAAAGVAGRPGGVAEALALVDLEPLAAQRVGALSGGERVRASLAVALVVQPALLCLDEPTGALDPRGLSLLARVLELLRSRGTAALVATHQPATLRGLADAHLRLSGGRWVAA